MRINVFKSGGNAAQGGFVSNGLNLQGPLILSGPHTEPLHAVPKQYVDNAAYNLDAENITSGVLAPARLPAFTGDVTTILGTSNINLANTGVTPGSIIKPTVDAKGRVLAGGTLTEEDISAISFDKVSTNRPTTLAGYGITNAISISNNNTIQGDLLLVSDPTNDEHAVTKQYVDSIAGIAGGISVGDIVRKPYTTTPAGFLKCNGAEVDKSIYANLYSVIGDTFNNDLTIGSGRPWQQQYRFNDSQTADVLGWVSDTALPSIFSHTTVVATKNRVYALGGYLGSGSFSATVYTAPINTDGTLGAWTTDTALPAGLIASSAIVTNNRVYLIGGATGTGTYLSTVRTAVINSDGTLGAWTTGPSLPGNLGWTKSIVTKNRVYTFGGYNGSAAISTIYTSTINSDGTLNSWSVHGTLPVALYVPYVAVIKDRVYIIGGWNGSTRLSSVYYAPIDTNGVIGTISSSVFLPKGMSHGECFTTKNKLHINFSNEIWTSNINSDGSLGDWYKSANLPVEMTDTECVITSSKIYLISSTTLAGGYTNNVVSANFSGGLNDYSGYYTADTNSYTLPGSGQPWMQQYEINNVQTENISTWTSGINLPQPSGAAAVFVTKNRVYLVGGFTTSGSITNNVYTATINSDGSIGSWTTETDYPVSVSGPGCFTYKNYVYILGGYTGSVSLTSIYRASINSDGTIGSWTLIGNLPNTNTSFATAIIKNKLYVIGGSGAGYLSTTYYTTISDIGELGTWTQGTSLPWAAGNLQVAVTRNKIYALTGFNSGSSYNGTAVASINSEGIIGSWSTSNSIVTNTSHTQVFVTKNKIYILGGYNSVSELSISGIQVASISEDGTIGTWSSSGVNIPAARNAHNCFVTNGKIYILGGRPNNNNTWTSNVYIGTISGGLNDYSDYYGDTTLNYMMPGSGRPWQQQYQINIAQTENITGWSAGTSLPINIANSQAIVTKNRVYLLGGGNGSVSFSTVYTAPINEDGTLGSWTNSGNNLPGLLSNSQAIVTKNRVYLLGGLPTPSTYTSIVYTAPINADGTLGSWSTSTSLPTNLAYSSSIITKNRVYLFGGHNGSNHTSAIQTASINADGTLGTWTSFGNLPGVLSFSQAVVTKNRVYLIGGFNGSTFVSTVYTATINNDGTLGSWVTGTSLPGVLGRHSVLITKNRVYILGGDANQTTFVSTVYTAPINADGTLGTWTAGTSLPGGLCLSESIIVKNTVYLLGGYTGASSVVSTVYKATIAEGLNDYSPYYDGTITAISTESTTFKLPDYTLLDKEFGEFVNSYIKF